jgi:hypothetical protein
MRVANEGQRAIHLLARIDRVWNGLSQNAPCHGLTGNGRGRFASKPAPTDRAGLQALWHLNNRGSRASALLQVILARLEVGVAPSTWSPDAGRAEYRFSLADIIPVGAGLLANAVVVATRVYLTHRVRGQARSYSWSGLGLRSALPGQPGYLMRAGPNTDLAWRTLSL